MPDNFASKELIIFDLDGTLTPSKSPIAKKTLLLLSKLLQAKKVAVIGGGDFKQFQKQLLGELNGAMKNQENIFIFPVNSTSFYRFAKGTWKKIYEYKLAKAQKDKIFSAVKNALKEAGYRKPDKVYGKTIEDRGSQITFSALGQNAPLSQKKDWNKKNDIRGKISKSLKKLLPQFEIRMGGLTSIDITEKGMDKAHGIRKIAKILNIPVKKILFAGDAIYPGGNDYPAKKTGVRCVRVKNPAETEILISKIIKN